MNKFNFVRRFFKNVVQKNEKNITDRKKVINAGRGTMLLMSPILFEVKHKEEENSPKTEHIFLTGKAIDFLTQKLFENEFGTSILYLSFFVAYLSLLAHDNKINLLVQKLKFKYSNNMFNVGHPNYKNYLKKKDILGKD
ncbi:ATP synthase-associated protein, putative [Plasmodium chabaudi chabaudi]|uniref:ATP synthase-associated protein, putative n=1 Tax=Plasmodium chabaudi chabaudi TaxID=31271 RepID=A0A4V0K755_PLACU|nr:ATP synthase-associated protein, putative [Plasmodium chabaudi chabaudi]VTZ68564.1 ATP synthase-associated protein, putative [Plasmodium chabaudi chabaudi]|eukprot:XP_745575.1 conserved Plasmodium protein, unknown function [Plasmodium chabaudi chabaudi]